MENLTCVIDAQTLVENVHEIKDWVYNGSIRLHVPICASEKLEQQYQAWLKAQEALKDPQPKRSSYKTATRKDHPLFDVNPRVAREFLLRSQADERNSSVSFQHPDEQFTQWKEEEEQALKVEQIPEERPTSFAQALLRKLNIAEESEGVNGPKAPAKPRLVARDTAAPKSPWKYHKVPTISSRGLPESMKPLLGCVLWRLHEYENNPLLPETCIMLTDDAETTEFMVKLKIPIANVRQLHQKLNKKQIEDARDKFGLVENEFAAKKREKVMAQVEPMNIKVNGAMSVRDIEKESGIENTVQSADSNKGLYKLESPKIVNGGPLTSTLSQEANHYVKHLAQIEQVKNDLETQYPNNFHERSLTPRVGSMVENSEKSEDDARIDVRESQPPSPCTRSGSVPVQAVDQGVEAEPSSGSTMSGQIAQAPAIAVELSDDSDDSDDEVVVFNPKSRRLSGTPKTSSEPSNPIEPVKPSKPISYLKALETGLPKRPVSAPKSPALTKPPDVPIPEQSNAHNDKLKPSSEAVSDPQIFTRESSSHNKNPNHPQHCNRSQRLHQRPVTIKAQNPRQTLIPSPVPAQIKQRPPPEVDPLSQKHIEKLLSDETRDFSRVEEFVALQTRGLMTPTSQLPEVLQSQDDNIPRNLSVHNDQELSTAVQVPPQHQHQQSRQRPHPRQPHRFDQGSPKFPRQPNKPQTISYPTIIDPDDFDRSPIIRPPRIHTPNGNSHSNHRMPGSPKRGGASKSTEPEVDFVLKSGAPRGSTRGRGKLWVP